MNLPRGIAGALLSISVAACVPQAKQGGAAADPSPESTVQVESKETATDVEKTLEVTLDSGSAAAFPPGSLAVGTEIKLEAAAVPAAFLESGFAAKSQAVAVSAKQGDKEVEFVPQSFQIGLAIDNTTALADGFVDSDDLCLLGKAASVALMIFPRKVLKIVDGPKGKVAQANTRAMGTYVFGDCANKKAIEGGIFVNADGRVLKLSLGKSIVTSDQATVNVDPPRSSPSRRPVSTGLL